MRPDSFDAEPSTPRPTGAPAASSARTGAMPAPSRPFDVGQCATPVPVARETADGVVGQVHAVRHPDVRAEPAEILGVLGRGAAELLPAERLLVVGLGEVGVQPDALLPGERRAVAHQLGGHGERRARRDRERSIESAQGRATGRSRRRWRRGSRRAPRPPRPAAGRPPTARGSSSRGSGGSAARSAGGLDLASSRSPRGGKT